MQAFVFITALYLALIPAAWGDQGNCSDSYRKLTQLIERNFFETRRTFEKYVELFPDQFFEKLSSLDDSGHWLDAGSGEAFAVEDFLKPAPLRAEPFLKEMQSSIWKPREIKVDPEKIRKLAQTLSERGLSQRPKVTAVSFSMERKGPTIEGLEIKTGRFFEDIPTSEFKPVDLITDLFGVASYSPRIDEVLRNYHRVLKKGGQVYLFIGDYLETPPIFGFRRASPLGEPGWLSAFSDSEVITSQGDKLSLLDWVQRLPGFKTTIEGREVVGKRQIGLKPAAILRSTLILEKTGDFSQIPQLKLVEATEDKPPIRIFREISLSDN